MANMTIVLATVMVLACAVQLCASERTETYLDNEYEKKCKSVLFNYEKKCGHDVYYGDVRCQFCQIDNANMTACYASNNLEVSEVFAKVPKTAEYLVILFDNNWFGYFPLHPGSIDFSGIANFTRLKYFEIVSKHHNLFQLYGIQAKSTSLFHLKHLKRFAIRIPITTNNSTVLNNIINELNDPLVLDLSYTRGIPMDDIAAIFQSPNTTYLKRLCLREFQLPGHTGYKSSFDVLTILLEKNITFPYLLELDLSNNMLTNMAPGISIVLPNLKRLDVSGNMLLDPTNFGLLAEALLHPILEILDFSNQAFEFYNLSPSIQSKTIQTNQFSKGMTMYNETQTMLENVVPHLKKYNSIIHCINSLSRGNISNLSTTHNFYCPFLKCAIPSAKLDCRKLATAPPQIDGTCNSFFVFPVGQNLKFIYFSNVHLEFSALAGIQFKSGRLCFIENNLTGVIFSGNKNWIKAVKIDTSVTNLNGVTGLRNLKYLLFGDNKMELNFSTKIGFTGTLNQLNVLDLSKNNINITTSPEICKNLPQLNSIYMSNSKIHMLADNIFQKCIKLELIDLSYNYITEKGLDNLNLSDAKSLVLLDVSHNNITTLGESLMKKLQKYKSLEVDLSENPLSCKCDNRNFIKWIQKNSAIFKRFYSYSCNGPKGNVFLNQIKNINGFWSDCDHLETIKVAVITCFSTSVFIIGCYLVFKLKWRIRYFLFQAKQFAIRLFASKDKKLKIWKYDAFISYCSTDRFWVHSMLMRILENKYGFNLCIHYRDFEAGAAIADNIADNMSQSREIILVLSEVATQSDWCQYELDQALYQKTKRKRSLVIIKLGQISNAALYNPKVAELLDSNTYLEWSVDRNQQKIFWATLVGKLLNDPKGGCNICCAYGAGAIDYKDLEIAANDTEEDEDEVLQHIPVAAQSHWKEAQKARFNTEMAKRYQSTLKDVLLNERLPKWAYGPLPHPIEELLSEHRDEINQQIFDYAHTKLDFLIKCLDTCIERQTQLYISEMTNVELAQQ